MTKQDLINDLRELIEGWEDEYESYIDSPVELERTMSVQQYIDKRELERVVDEHEH